MHSWEAIQKSVDYIEAHLQEDIKTEMLAEMVQEAGEKACQRVYQAAALSQCCQ